MSMWKTQLCSLILKEHFGDVVEKVAVHLAKKSFTALRLLAQETGLQLQKVKKALQVLIQHHIVQFEQNKKGFVEYNINTDNVMVRLRFARFIYTAKTLYGDSAELVVEEILQHGQIEMSRVVKHVTDRLNEALEGEDKVQPFDVRDKFINLARTHFIKRCASVEPVETDSGPNNIPSFADEVEENYEVPTMDVDYVEGRKRKRSTDDSSDQPSKRLKTGQSQATLTDEGILWRINYTKFHSHLRDQAIISAVGRKLDKKAAEIVRTILRLSELTTDEEAPATNPLSYNQIFQALSEDSNISKQALDQYLKLLVDDTTELVLRAGDSGGGMYNIDFHKCFRVLCKVHIESVVQERFGSKCLRVFKLLLLKKQLEQKQIEECAMIPAKEAKEMLYRLFGEHFIAIAEVPKTPDHAPSRTFYLFSVNINQVTRLLLERCYKTLGNMVRRREHETKEHRRLLEKQQRVEAIAASLEHSGADQTQKEEIEEMISPTERAQLNKVKHMINKLEQSEIQLDDTVFVLQTYLAYDHGK